jgi:hypothetical protein
MRCPLCSREITPKSLPSRNLRALGFPFCSSCTTGKLEPGGYVELFLGFSSLSQQEILTRTLEYYKTKKCFPALTKVDPSVKELPLAFPKFLELASTFGNTLPLQLREGKIFFRPSINASLFDEFDTSLFVDEEEEEPELAEEDEEEDEEISLDVSNFLPKLVFGPKETQFIQTYFISSPKKGSLGEMLKKITVCQTRLVRDKIRFEETTLEGENIRKWGIYNHTPVKKINLDR